MQNLLDPLARSQECSVEETTSGAPTELVQQDAPTSASLLVRGLATWSPPPTGSSSTSGFRNDSTAFATRPRTLPARRARICSLVSLASRACARLGRAALLVAGIPFPPRLEYIDDAVPGLGGPQHPTCAIAPPAMGSTILLARSSLLPRSCVSGLSVVGRGIGELWCTDPYTQNPTPGRHQPPPRGKNPKSTVDLLRLSGEKDCA